MDWDWIPYLRTLADSGVTDMVANNALQFVLVRPGQNQRMVIERVVGTSFLTSHTSIGTVNPYLWEVVERLYVMDMDNTNAPEYAPDLFDADDFDRTFMWERRMGLWSKNGNTYVTEEGSWTNYDGDLGHPYWSAIDVQVSRKLRDRECLVYQVEWIQYVAQPIAGLGEAFIHVAPRLRIGAYVS